MKVHIISEKSHEIKYESFHIFFPIKMSIILIYFFLFSLLEEHDFFYFWCVVDVEKLFNLISVWEPLTHRYCNTCKHLKVVYVGGRVYHMFH